MFKVQRLLVEMGSIDLHLSWGKLLGVFTTGRTEDGRQAGGKMSVTSMLPSSFGGLHIKALVISQMSELRGRVRGIGVIYANLPR
jgi:hypothetical protein